LLGFEGQAEHRGNTHPFFLGGLLKYRKALGGRSEELLKSQLLA
jgi:hypothetical protein